MLRVSFNTSLVTVNTVFQAGCPACASNDKVYGSHASGTILWLKKYERKFCTRLIWMRGPRAFTQKQLPVEDFSK